MSNNKLKIGIFMFILASFILNNFISAYTINPSVPTDVQLSCRDTYYKKISLEKDSASELISVNPIIVSRDNVMMGLTYSTLKEEIYLSFYFLDSDCNTGKYSFSFEINSQTYEVSVNVTEDLEKLDTISIYEDAYVEVGDKVKFEITNVVNEKIYYTLECYDDDEEKDGSLKEEDSVSISCDNNNYQFILDRAYNIDKAYAKITIYSSDEDSEIVLSSNSSSSSSSCVLGLDTLGAKVTRGNIFAIKTINSNTNTYVPNVAVTIIDQSGGLSAISGSSSNIGFFSQRLFEDYKQDLIVQLEKEGCEPYSNTILFDNTYNDYLSQKEEKKDSSTLKMDFSSSVFLVNNELKGTVTNLLDESIEGVDVKITNEEQTSTKKTTDSSGIFSFNPSSTGTWTISLSKSGYTSTEVYTFSVINGDYSISAYVDGERKSKFSSGDKIIFKLTDSERNVIDLDVIAKYGNDEISFTNGVSDVVSFVNNYRLVVPKISGYSESTFITSKEEGSNSWIWWVVVVISVVIGIFVIIRMNSIQKPINRMNVQLGSSN